MLQIESLVKKMENYNYDKKRTLVRLKKIRGQMDGIIQMIENNRECNEIAIQLSAVKSGVEKINRIILAENIRTSILSEDEQNSEDLLTALNIFINSK